MYGSETDKAYAALGLTPGAPEPVVRRAWRNLVKDYHPDLHKIDPVAAHRKLVEINAAFDLLGGHLPKEPAPQSQSKNQNRTATQNLARKPHSGKRASNKEPRRVFVVNTVAQEPAAKLTVLYPTEAKRDWTEAERQAARAAMLAFATARKATDRDREAGHQKVL